MRILITQETDWLKRNPAQQHHLAEMLSLRGHEIRAIDYELLWKTQGKRELYSKRQVFGNVSKIHKGAKITVIRPGIIKIPCLDYVSLVFSHKKEINRQIKEFNPDAIIGFGILNSYLAAIRVRDNNTPFIYYWIDVLHKLIPSKLFQPIGKRLESVTLKRADRVLVINDKLREYVINLGAPQERAQVLRAGIDINQFSPNISGDPVRRQYGLMKEDTVLFFMGWLYKFSGLKEVALKLAESKNHSLKLLVVGEGDTYEELQQIREEYHLHDRIILTGKKPYEEIPAFIAASDICLLPAYPWESIMQDIVPIKMYEYMAMGKPVISTRLPGIVEEFGKNNGVAYVDRPEDVISKAIELARDGSAKKLGLKGREFVERNSWDKITDGFEEILEQVIKDKQNRIWRCPARLS
ncbi:D-inositol-3-phosphate glycosyltransferase [subsurface metagenome]